ncbi:unnamed protein product [Strongylus vulgaris]|uniref:Uncharacterized protein n=1 Tax=Strongylus vulgaris TaxID=40348 RepID=A0A3P7J724_STRVU|nr:unnamed protein product [Strongylus vulgaris]
MITKRTPVLLQSSKTLLTCVEKRALRPGPSQEGLVREAGEQVQIAVDSTVEKVGEIGEALKETIKATFEKVTDVGTTAGQAFRETAEVTDVGNTAGQAFKETAEVCFNDARQSRNVTEGFKGFFPSNVSALEPKKFTQTTKPSKQIVFQLGQTEENITQAEGIIAEEADASELLAMS